MKNILLIENSSLDVKLTRSHYINYLKEKSYGDIDLLVLSDISSNKIIQIIWCLFYLILKSKKYSIIHGFRFEATTAISIFSLLNKNIKLVSTLTGLGNFHQRNKILKKNWLKLILFSIKNNNVVSVQNTADAELFKNSTKVIFGSGIPKYVGDFNYEIKRNTTPLLVYAGRLSKDKGIYDLIEHTILQKGKFHLDIYSNGIPTKALQAKINQFDYIKFKGFNSRIRNILKDADYTVLPSTYGEGIPRVLLESLSVGTPIIATKNSGSSLIEEISNKCWVGYFLNNNTEIESLLKKIELSVNKDSRKKIIEFFEINFSSKFIFPQYEDLYR